MPNESVLLSPRPEGRVRPRFRAERPSHRLRVAMGSLSLVGLGSVGFSVLGRVGSRKAIHSAERLWARAATRLLRLRIEIEGLQHVETGETYLVVALHEGLADVLALLQLPLPMRFMARDELFAWPALGRYLKSTGQVMVDEPTTRASLRRLLSEARAGVTAGDSLVVFPQGSILGVEVAFQRGAFHIAKRLGRPLLPVALSGSHRVWEHPYSPVVRLDQRVSMRVLPAIASGDLSPERFRELERELKGIALNPNAAPARRFDPERDGWWDGYRYEIDPDYPELAARLARRRGAWANAREGAR